MGVLQRFERRLGGLVEGAFAKVFKGGVEPVEIASALARETDDRRAISSNRVLVPNEFAVELASSDFARLAPYTAQLCDELGEMVREHAGEQRYTFVGPVSVRLSEAPDLDVGVFRIRSSVAAAEPGVVGGRRPAASRSARPGGPRLVATRKDGPSTGGDREYALETEVTVIGRGERSDIRLNDTGVSRHHGEVRRLPDGAFLYVDNGSTNGSIVNGRRATEVKLVDGDRIELGAAVLIFRREDGPGAERARAARATGGPPPADAFSPARPGQPPGRPGYGGGPRSGPRDDPHADPGRERPNDRYRPRPSRDSAVPPDPYGGEPYEGETLRPATRPPAAPYRGTGPRGGAERRPEPGPSYDSSRDRGGRGGRSGGDPYGGYGGSGHAGPDAPQRGYPDDERPIGRPGARGRPAPAPPPPDDDIYDAQTRLPGRMPPPGRSSPDDRPRSRPDESW